MTEKPDHDITMTGPETAALAPFLPELRHDDLAYLLRHHRAMGYAVKAARIFRPDAPTIPPTAILADDTAHEDYGDATYVGAAAALRALYADDTETADAALAALDAMGATDDR